MEKKPAKVNKVRVGDSFGEIALLYNCRRSASVVSTKYATLGWLPLSKYNELHFKFHGVKEKLKDQVFNYSDSLKLFKENRLREIPYFRNLSQSSIHDVIFKLKTMHSEKGSLILKEDETVDKMFIVQDGLIDIEIFVDNENFVLESLPRGAIINHHKFLFGKKFKLTGRCKTFTSVLYLTIDDFYALMDENEEIYSQYAEYEVKLQHKINQKTLLLDFLFPISVNADSKSAKYLK